MTDSVENTKAPRASDVDKMHKIGLKLAKAAGKANLSPEELEKMRSVANLLYSTAQHVETMQEHGTETVSLNETE